MKTKFLYNLIFIAYLFIYSQSTQLRSQTKTLTSDCTCECPCCCSDPCVQKASCELHEAKEDLVQLLINRDEAENEFLGLNDRAEIVEHEALCTILCAAEALEGYNNQALAAIDQGNCNCCNQLCCITNLLSSAIIAQNEQLESLASFCNPSDEIVCEINKIIYNMQAMEEQIYNLICGVKFLEFNSLKFKENTIEKENELQAILLQFGDVITNMFPNNLVPLTQLSAEQISKLIESINHLLGEEICKVDRIHEQAELINIIRHKVWDTLNDVFEKNADYQNALDRCQREDLVKVYGELTELARNCVMEQHHCPIEVPCCCCCNYPCLELCGCECPPVPCIECIPPVPVELPPVITVCPGHVCPPECAPYDRCCCCCEGEHN